MNIPLFDQCDSCAQILDSEIALKYYSKKKLQKFFFHVFSLLTEFYGPPDWTHDVKKTKDMAMFWAFELQYFKGKEIKHTLYLIDSQKCHFPFDWPKIQEFKNLFMAPKLKITQQFENYKISNKKTFSTENNLSDKAVLTSSFDIVF